MRSVTKSIKLVCAVTVFSFCFAQVTLASSKGDYDPYNGMIMLFKNLPPWLEMGADFRFRVVYDDARKMDEQATGHDRINTRYRGRVQAKIKQSENFVFDIIFFCFFQNNFTPDNGLISGPPFASAEFSGYIAFKNLNTKF